MRKLYLIILILTICLASAQIHERGEDLDIKVPFEVNGSSASALATCNISVISPNSTSIVENVSMFNNKNGIFNYSLDGDNVNELGDYQWIAFCCDEGKCAVGYNLIKVTQTGKELSSGQGIVSIAVILGVLALSFLFVVVGIKLSEMEKLMPIAFFFIVFSIILGIYSLHLGYAFTTDLLEYESLSPVTSSVYIAVIWSVTGIAIISVMLMLIAFIKELGMMAKTQKFGEGFNPITDTYDF